PPLPETLVNSVLSISFNTPDCLIVTIGTVCENQDTSVAETSDGEVIAEGERGSGHIGSSV
ncbi:hypothetical protein, partial [Aeromonas caviae]|uniref:hypothetical protein n=1 Tax=Aeromonas caviae TaxID=648 RepID=UPI001CC3E677